MYSRLMLLLAVMFVAAFFMGCSTGGGLADPVSPNAIVGGSGQTHSIWGVWQFIADPGTQTLDVVQLRGASMHVNALPFLEPPPPAYLTVESHHFNGNIIEADIGLRNPFVGINKFTGFDVCGILISNGSVSGFNDPDLIMAGDGDTRLLNADGYTRWWNPSEFPHDGSMFSYTDGILGVPDDVADYNSTLNGYKLFADIIAAADDSLDTVPVTSRLEFTAGMKNVRHYTIQLGTAGFVFNYAVDASWKAPIGDPPYVVPDDFPPGANRAEAWNVQIVETSNSLWNDGASNGGGLDLSIDVWDHYDANLNTLKIESPGNFAMTSSATPVGGGDGYSTYEVEVLNATPSTGTIDLLITVESEISGYGGLLPGKTVSSYFAYQASVSNQNPSVDCGTGNHTNPVTTPFQDSAEGIRFDLAWLVSGPYAGEMLVPGYNGTVTNIRRYNADTIGPLTGIEFAALPAIACPPAPDPYTFNPFLFHMKVEPYSGRVIAVPFGLGANNSLLVFDDTGALISSENGISVGDGRKIMAIYPNSNGDLWMITGYQLSYDVADDCRLQRFVYQPDDTIYALDPSFDLQLDDILGFYYNETYGNVVENFIVDLVIIYPEQRIFVWSSANYKQHNGKLDIFDINPDTPPTYMPDISNGNLLTQPTWNSHTDYMTVESAGITVDNSNPSKAGCRVSVFARCNSSDPPGAPIMLARLDKDGLVLSETNLGDAFDTDAMGVNPDPDPLKAFLVFTGYSSYATRMLTPPADW